MLLVVDIGNSHTVVGLYVDDILHAHWRLKSDLKQTVDEIAIQFHTLFSMAAMPQLKITGIIISSVVPSLEASWLECCAKHFSTHLSDPPFIVSDKTMSSLITIDIDYPGEVGADRLVNGLAAWSQYRTNLIVIDFGTAITFDCITENCAYIGGTILPGVAISLEALAGKTAKLPHIDISTPPASIIGKNTVDAMKSGILHGYGAMIDGLVDTLGQQMSTNTPPQCLATGGMANVVIPYCKNVHRIEQMLTLKGLHYIYTTACDRQP